MQIKLFDSELKVMDLLWKEGAISARRLAELLGEQTGWSKTTTYTVIRKCLEKGAIARSEPNFICTPLLTKEEVQASETDELIAKLYDGAADQLVASLLGQRRLTPQEIAHLKKLVEELQ